MPPHDLVRSLPIVDQRVDGRTIEGTALKWDTLYRVSDDGKYYYQEGFRRGAFAESIRNRENWYEMRTEHADIRVGRAEFVEDTDCLRFTARFDYGDPADDELELVRSGHRAGVSIRYRPITAERSGGLNGRAWWRTRVDVRELSLTSRPQYGADAKVLVVRHMPSEDDAELRALLDWKAPAI